MKISFHWLNDFVDCKLLSPSEIETLLRQAGLEVKEIETRGVHSDYVVVARILESIPHPNADRLSVCQVDDGSGKPRQIVCGAKNYKPGDNVPLALPGAVLPGDFKIKVGKLREIESQGMMCSAKELHLAEDAEGLLILPPDAKPGTLLHQIVPADIIFELEITPNRPDWLSHLGIAREIGIFTGRTVTPPKIVAPPCAPAGEAVSLEAKECSYYTVRKIRGVKVGPSPEWLCQRLSAIGLRPVNNVVDITNYVLFELGQPLHAFDSAKISGSLRIRHATANENFRALDGRDYTLQETDLVIADTKGPVALAGIMGGIDSSVTPETTDILLESAVFDPQTVRRTSRRLGLASDSSYRFERGIDPEMTTMASARAVALITEIAGGNADESLFEVGTLYSRQEVKLRHNRVRSLLGLELFDDEIEISLTKIGLEKISGGKESFWIIPGFRRDISREADLVEEIARVVGIERIPSRHTAIFVPTSAPDRTYDFVMTLRQRLVGFGFHEARTSTLISASEAACFGTPIELKNPFGDDQSCLRTSLLPGLLAALKRNLDHGATSIQLFECGRIFSRSTAEESVSLALVAYGSRGKETTWRSTAAQLWDVFDLKGLVRELAELSEEDFSPQQPPPEPFGAAVKVLRNGLQIGILGQLQPSEVRKLGAAHPIFAAEFYVQAWQNDRDTTRITTPLPRFPSSTRDIALVAPLDLAFSSIKAVLIAQKEPLLDTIRLFDVFTDPTGKKLPADKKSLAISLTFRSPERTLKAEEVNACTNRLKAALKEHWGVDFRE